MCLLIFYYEGFVVYLKLKTLIDSGHIIIYWACWEKPAGFNCKLLNWRLEKKTASQPSTVWCRYLLVITTIFFADDMTFVPLPSLTLWPLFHLHFSSQVQTVLEKTWATRSMRTTVTSCLMEAVSKNTRLFSTETTGRETGPHVLCPSSCCMLLHKPFWDETLRSVFSSLFHLGCCYLFSFFNLIFCLLRWWIWFFSLIFLLIRFHCLVLHHLSKKFSEGFL